MRPRKTHCTHGHPLTEDNIYVYRDRDRTRRRCKTCARKDRMDTYFRTKGVVHETFTTTLADYWPLPFPLPTGKTSIVHRAIQD
jgi:hypothetical protein